MIGLRWLRTTARGALGLFLVAPVFGLALAILFDRGPSGQPRLSPHLFPVVLWVFDDFAWTCARNSLVFALLVALISLFLGVGVRILLARLPSWGRTILGGAIGTLVVVSPAFLALGIMGFLGPPHPWPWPFATVLSAESPGASLESWRGLPLWVAWIWTSLPAAVALVSLVTAPAIEQMEPSWGDAARLAGAGPFRTWRKLSWAIIRPSAARAAALVFVLALVEPGAPLILGLRRTLAFQIVDAAAEIDSSPRVAVWAMMAALFGWCGWALFRWRGRSAFLKNQPNLAASPPGPASPRRAPARPALASTLALAAWALACWVPTVSLIRLSVAGAEDQNSSEVGAIRSFLGLLRRTNDPSLPELAASSAALGFEVACAIIVVAWLVRRGHPGRCKTNIWVRLLRPIAQLPPLVQAVGVLSLSWLAGLASRVFLDSGQSTSGLALESLAAALGPIQNPWILMVTCVFLSLAPWFSKSGRPVAELDPRRPEIDSAFESALLAGSSRVRARGLATPWRHWRALGQFLLVWALAATNVTPALLFLPWSEHLTVGPAVLVFSSADRASESLAAALALGAVALNITALAVARALSALPRSEDLE